MFSSPVDAARLYICIDAEWHGAIVCGCRSTLCIRTLHSFVVCGCSSTLTEHSLSWGLCRPWMQLDILFYMNAERDAVVCGCNSILYIRMLHSLVVSLHASTASTHFVRIVVSILGEQRFHFWRCAGGNVSTHFGAFFYNETDSFHLKAWTNVGSIFERRFRSRIHFFGGPDFVGFAFRRMKRCENRVNRILTHIRPYWTIRGFIGAYFDFQIHIIP